MSPHCETYAYVLLPGKNAEETKHYADNPNTHILLQSSEAHAVYHTGLDILGMNVWTDAKISAGGVTCLGKASVMVRATDDSVEVALSDPTQENNGIIELELDMAVSSVEKADPSIEVLQLSPKVKLQVHAGGTYGSTLSVKLSKSK
ncbi:Xanthan lyase precursor [compost metagenome]